MCWCDPNIRTPKCASLQCVPPIMVFDPAAGTVQRAERLREAYVDRRQPPLDSLTGADLADLIATHSIHVAPYGAIVYARIDTREVGVKYSATGGDKAKAVRLAVREVLRLVGVVS